MVELTEQEKQLPYAKYFYQELATIPEEKIAVGEGSQADSILALDLEDKNLFLKGEDKGIQTGFCVAENGVGYVANSTFMQNVTVEMLDWWFGWHSISSDLRYKLWDHDDHYHARADKPEYVLDPEVPVNQKTWGVNHSIKEDIGLGPENITLCFKCPKDFGYDMNIIGNEKCESLVCAIGVGEVAAFMTHKFYSVPGGAMFESRFWMGYAWDNNEFIKLIPDGASIPEHIPRALFNHNIKEYSNLAAILPNIYKEEKDNWE